MNGPRVRCFICRGHKWLWTENYTIHLRLLHGIELRAASAIAANASKAAIRWQERRLVKRPLIPVQCPMCGHSGSVDTITGPHLSFHHPKLSLRERSEIACKLRMQVRQRSPGWRLSVRIPTGAPPGESPHRKSRLRRGHPVLSNATYL